VSFTRHTSGGHFAVSSRILAGLIVLLSKLTLYRLQAMEKPEELLADVEEWVKRVWKDSKL